MIEIERKYRVHHPAWEALEKPAGQLYRQGYLSRDPEKTIRVRLTETTAFLTIKGRNQGLSRLEFEYEIPLDDARMLLDQLAEAELSKVRYHILHEGKLWEVDVFQGRNAGLIVAEIELTREDESYTLPPWVADEVTHDPRYLNSNLTTHPFQAWS